jgi:hypothetical protein
MSEKLLIDEMRDRTAKRLNADSAKVIADEQEAQKRAEDEAQNRIAEQAQLYIKELEKVARKASGKGKQEARIIRDEIGYEVHDDVSAAMDMASEYFEAQGFEAERKHRYMGRYVYGSLDNDDFVVTSFIEGLEISW